MGSDKETACVAETAFESSCFQDTATFQAIMRTSGPEQVWQPHFQAAEAKLKATLPAGSKAVHTRLSARCGFVRRETTIYLRSLEASLPFLNSSVDWSTSWPSAAFGRYGSVWSDLAVPKDQTLNLLVPTKA